MVNWAEIFVWLWKWVWVERSEPKPTQTTIKFMKCEKAEFSFLCVWIWIDRWYKYFVVLMIERVTAIVNSTKCLSFCSFFRFMFSFVVFFSSIDFFQIATSTKKISFFEVFFFICSIFRLCVGWHRQRIVYSVLFCFFHAYTRQSLFRIEFWSHKS